MGFLFSIRRVVSVIFVRDGFRVRFRWVLYCMFFGLKRFVGKGIWVTGRLESGRVYGSYVFV